VFTFTKNEPSRPAGWRGFTIDHTLKGEANPLHGKQCVGPVLGPADILELLSDIEKKILSLP